MPFDRLISTIKQDRVWDCPTCGRQYKEGSLCPQEAEHWEDFISTMSTTASPTAFEPAA